MRPFVSIAVVTSVACLVGLSLKKGDYLRTPYQEFMTPQTWRRVEIVDEKSMFEKLLRDYIWEYAEVLVVGLTACFITFTIGWSAANSMRKGSADSGDEDIPEECLEENCDLSGRVEEVEEITTELERSGHRISTRNASNIELKLSEGETTNKAYRSDYNGNRQEIEEDTTTSLTCLKIEKVNGEPATHKGAKIKSETCDKLITTEIYNKSGLAYLTRDKSNISYPKSVETDDLFDESTNPHNRDCHELSKEDKVFTYRKVKISQFLPKKVTAVDALGGCKSRNEKSNHVGGQVQEAVVEVESNLNKSRSTKTDTLEASRNEHGDSYLNSFGCTKTGSSPEERTINKSEVNRNINKVGDTNLEMDSNNGKNFSTKIIEGRVEVEPFSKLDVSPSTLTADVDGMGPGRDSAHRRESSHRIDSRGRTPHYQNLNREIKPDHRTTKLNKKDNRTMRTPTAPHQYIDELSKDVLSKHQINSERPSSTGDTLHAKGSQRRKKNQKYHAQNSSNKTDSKNC